LLPRPSVQDNYARLSKEFEALKLSLAKSPAGPGRDGALAQIRERESEFRSLQQSEATFFERLISGETLFSNALAQLSQKENERKVVDNLFKRIVAEGHSISLGEPTIHAGLDNKNVVGISVPVTITVTESIKMAMEQTARSLGSPILQVDSRIGIPGYSVRGLSLRMGNDLDAVQYFQKRIAILVFVMEARLTDGSSIGCFIAPEYERYGMAGYMGALGIAPVASITQSSNPIIMSLRLGRSSDYFPLTAGRLRECSIAVPVPKIQQRSSVSDDLNRQLEEELKKIKQFQPPPPAPKFRDLSPAAK